jgi:hypothetical protein
LDAFVAWLNSVGWTVFVWSMATLVVIDLAALAAAAMTRDRTLVNRWTGRVLAANVALLGFGAAGPAISFTGRMAMGAVARFAPSSAITLTAEEVVPTPENAPNPTLRR